MKIAILADPLDNQRAGVHVYVRELVSALAKNPGEHEYLLIRQRRDPSLPFQQIIVPTTRRPVGYASLRLFVLIPRLIRKHGVDVVFEPAHFGPFNLPRYVRRVTMIHDLTPILFPEFHPWLSQRLQHVFLPGILRRADLVIANSRNTEADLHRVYPTTRGKVKTILLGRNESIQADMGTAFITEHGLTDGYFLYVGTLEPRKNLLLLLAAYQLFRERGHPAIPLVFVGQMGWKNEAFNQALAEQPYRKDIKLLGFIPKLHLLQAYTHASCLIYPSIYEGFGFPILEAMACGTNVICPDNSSLPEVGGAAAYYFDTHSATGLADRMQEVARGGQEVEARAALGKQLAQTFSWQRYATEFNRAMSTLGEPTARKR